MPGVVFPQRSDPHLLLCHTRAGRAARLGALFHCSAREFDRRFRGETGEGTASWIRRRRMEHARRWLALGRSPSTIAEELGYAGLSQFSRAFKATVGVYPSCWPTSVVR